MNEDNTINASSLFLKLGIMELPLNCLVVISVGKEKVRKLPEHGEYRIVLHQGKFKWKRSEES